MPERIVIVGCGGHGREILGVLQAINEVHGGRWSVIGFVDDAPSEMNLKRLDRLGASYLGGSAELATLPRNSRYLIGIGNPRVRAEVWAKIDQYGMRPARIIHPTATAGPDTTIGDGCVLFAGARVTTNVTLGQHVHVNQNATIGHDSVLGDCVAVNPLAAVSGDCRLGNQVLVGTTAAVLQGLHVDTGAIVGAGACVVRNVPAGAVVKGVPAR